MAMRSREWLILAAVTLILAQSGQALCQQVGTVSESPHILDNEDVLMMVKRGMNPEAIKTRILSSRCNFDVFPPALIDLRRRGVPEDILNTMKVVPNGPSSMSEPENNAPATAKVKLPSGLGIEVETLYPVSSADIKKGSVITFAVVSPVYVDGVLAVARGAVAKAHIIKARKAQVLGRGGMFTWTLDHVIGVDGTQIPVRLAAGANGGNRAGEAAAGAALTSALVFPYTAPAALVWAFKKGDEAVLRGSKRFAAMLTNDAEVTGLVLDKDRVIYHYADAVKQKLNSASTPTAFPRMAVRN